MKSHIPASASTSEMPSNSLTKTTSNCTNNSAVSHGFDDASEFVTAASSLAAADGIQDWLDGSTSNGATSKRQDRPKWTLHTESELHVQRLEARLESLKKAKQTSRRKLAAQADHLDFDPDSHDLDNQEILAGQEESDEGLWLLWNNQAPSPSQQAPSSSPATAREITTASQSPQPSQSPSFSASGSVDRAIPTINPPHMQHYGSMNMSQSEISKDREHGSESDDERVEREERLDQARQRAKHIDQYTRGTDRRCCAVCPTGCVIS
ncbi:hypothetical protein BGZ73_003470 [Actinomortierella ambigua]|nr:hypothetical protein BGZ73_003470 [Actinomortierella ambigua]